MQCARRIENQSDFFSDTIGAQFVSVFARWLYATAGNDDDLVDRSLIEHRIEKGNHLLFRQARHVPYPCRIFIESSTNINLWSGSAWCTQENAATPPLVVVVKKEDTLPICVDYRQLNQMKNEDVYSLPESMRSSHLCTMLTAFRR